MEWIRLQSRNRRGKNFCCEPERRHPKVMVSKIFVGQVAVIAKVGLKTGTIRWSSVATTIGSWLLITWLILNGQAAIAQDKLSPAELRSSINGLKNKIEQSTKLLADGEIEKALESATSSRTEFDDLFMRVDQGSRKQLRPVYLQLSSVFEKLALEGADLPPMKSWDDLLKEKMPPKDTTPQGTISFQKDIAPWIVTQCGRCHIDATRGNLSLASYATIMRGSNAGVILFPGDARSSRMVEVLESGDMPRGGGRVSPENIEKLKTWIAEGAKSDAPAPDTPLRSLIGDSSAATSPTPQMNLAVAQPTGKETVSFAADIAPVLIENCKGCHIASMRNSGGLRMDNFSQLLRGGTSGPMIAPGKSNESLLIRKLRGEAGQRMPAGGRPPLPAEQIQKIATWIDEGAAFDGGSSELNIEQLANIAWSKNTDESSLRDKRWDAAKQLWTLAIPNQTPNVVSDEQFIVLGDVGGTGVESILRSAQAATKLVNRRFGLPESNSLVRGGVAIYAFRQRYEYSEFGKMAESRTLPSNWNGHWREEPINVYAALVTARNDATDTATLVQLLSSIHVASFEGFPTWLADGIGRAQRAALFSKSDPIIQEWEKQIPFVAAKLTDPDMLISNKMDDDEAALAGYALARQMMDKSGKKQYDTLFRFLRKGTPFDEAFRNVYGPQEVFLRSWIGSPAR